MQGTDHPESTPRRFALSVKALVRNRGDRYLVLRRSVASTADPGRWDLPGGKVDDGEDFVVALLREITEEIGLSVTIENLEGAVATELPGLKIVHLIMAALLAAYDKNGARVRVSPEHVEYRWAARRELGDFEFCPALWPIVASFIGDACRAQGNTESRAALRRRRRPGREVRGRSGRDQTPRM